MICITFHTKEVIITAFPKGKYAWSVTVGAKGQIVIPKEAREVFGIRPGDTLLLLGDEEQGLAIPNKSTFSDLISRIFAHDGAQGAGEEAK